MRNGIGLPAVYDAGLRLALKRILRIGVALLGIRLSLSAAGAIGLVAAVLVGGVSYTMIRLLSAAGLLGGLA